ncbi:unnamed protein product [Sympodiomycopsis kandeliae]
MLSHIAGMRLSMLLAVVLATLSTSTLAKPPKSFLSRAAQSPSGVVHLDSKGYNSIVHQGVAERGDYSLSILLTALKTPGVDCQPCQAFQPEYENLSKAWKKKNGKNFAKGDAGHYFVQVEFSEGKEVFMQMGLSHAPVLVFLPAGKPGNQGVQFDFNQHGFEAGAVANYLSKALDRDIGYRKPFPWRSVLTFSAGAGLVTVAFLFAISKFNTYLEHQARLEGNTSGGGPVGLHWRQVAGWFFQLFSLAVITIMCSGYMWNNIRSAPYVGMKNGGKIEYFTAGFQNQLGVETQIVSVIYTVLAFSVVALTLLVPGQRDPTKQRLGVYVWSFIFLAGVSVLFAVFRIKNPSYPFRLFL